MTHPTYRTADVDGFEVFYREAATARSRRCCCTASPRPAICVGHWTNAWARVLGYLFNRSNY